MRLFGLVLVCSLISIAAHAQSAAPVRVAVAGGLLGQIEGFPELPSLPVDWPQRTPVPHRLLGGVEGLQAWVASNKPGLLLLGGDNLPITIGRSSPSTTAFLSRLQSVVARQPTTVALGTDDVLRFLRTSVAGSSGTTTPAAAALEQWLENSPIPFLASNAVIVLRRDGLNVVKSGDIVLEVDEDSSIGWEKELRLRRPCTLQPALTLSTGGSQVSTTTAHKRDGQECHSILTVTTGGRLEPGREYVMGVSVGAAARAPFRFHTHRALTPSRRVDSSGRLPAASGFPVAPPVQAADHPWVISLVDPNTAKLSGPALKWQCPVAGRGGTCELTFLPALPATMAMMDVIKARDTSGAPFVALLSSMPDAVTSEVLGTFSAIRLTVLQADSGLLGLAAEGSDITLAGGATQKTVDELRSAALLDGRDPTTTALLVRPEWVAETVVSVSITQSVAGGSRSFQGTTFGTQLVDGAALCWAPASNGQTAYSVMSVTNMPFAILPSYPEGSAFRFLPSGGAPSDLWVDSAKLSAAALDVMRDRGGAELALVPELLVDEDVVEWLRHVQKDLARPLDWLSRLILERVLYRADAYVRTVIPGKELVTKVNAILDEAKQQGEAFCLAGFGQTGCDITKLDADHLLVNGRHIDETHYYSVAVSRGIADRHSLAYDEDKVRDIVDDLDARLRRGTPAVPTAGCTSDLLNIQVVAKTPAPEPESETPTLGETLESERDGPQAYLKLDPIKIDYALSNTTLPDGANETLLGQAIEGAKPNDYQRWQVDTKGDLAVFDTRHWAVRFTGELEYQQQEVGDEQSIDKDEFTLGGRLDHKIRLGKTTARLFGGWFLEGGIAGRDAKAATSRLLEQIREGDRVVQETVFNGPELAYRTEPRRFRYFTTGGELAGWSRWSQWTITQLSVQYDFNGTSENELVAILLNGVPLSMEGFLKDGAAKLLRKHFTDASLNPSAADVLTLDYQPVGQSRMQVHFNTEHPLAKIAKKDLKLTNEFRFRRYRQDRELPFALEWSIRESLALNAPVWSRLSAVFKVEFDTVEVNALSRNFEVFRFTAGFELPLFGKLGGGGLFFQ